MNNVPFDKLWHLLEPEGEFCRRKKACEKRWNDFSPLKQRMIYSILVAKMANGQYVSPNPYFAIDDNDKPVFLSGTEQDRMRQAAIPLVMVKYRERFLVCTQQTMNAYNLEFIRNV